MSIDLVLRGGTVVDGTGSPEFTAAVAIAIALKANEWSILQEARRVR